MIRPWCLPGLSVAALVLALAGCGGSGGSGQKLAPGEIAIEVTDAGFVPAVVKVPKGRPATLVVTRKTDATCATAMVFAANGEKHELPMNEPVRVTLPAERADTLDYACPMNMISGKVVSE